MQSLVSTSLSTSTHRDFQCPDSVVCKDLLLSEGDLEGSKGGAPTLWPVLLTLLLIALLEVGHHDDNGGPFLPHQPPEVDQHVLLRTYCVNVNCLSPFFG